MASTDKALLSVVRLEMFCNEAGITTNYPAGRATGFLYKNKDGEPRLMTNRHVVCERREDHHPDFVIAHVRVAKGPVSRMTMSRTQTIRFELYENGREKWKALSDRRVDIAALEIDGAGSEWFATWLSAADWLPVDSRLLLGSPVLVCGFPKGAFYDRFTNVPIARTATVATNPRVAFNKRPCFLLDGNLSEGMSGSPVVSLPGAVYEKDDRPVFDDKDCYLLGVFSAEWLWGNDPLGLHTVWGVDLIEETAQL